MLRDIVDEGAFTRYEIGLGALADAAEERLQELGYGNVTVRHGNGNQGWPEYAPVNGVIVTAAAPHVPPPLIKQLKPGARLVIPAGHPGGVQQLLLVEKRVDGSVSSRSILMVAFVPLTRSQSSPRGRCQTRANLAPSSMKLSACRRQPRRQRSPAPARSAFSRCSGVRRAATPPRDANWSACGSPTSRLTSARGHGSARRTRRRHARHSPAGQICGI